MSFRIGPFDYRRTEALQYRDIDPRDVRTSPYIPRKETSNSHKFASTSFSDNDNRELHGYLSSSDLDNRNANNLRTPTEEEWLRPYGTRRKITSSPVHDFRTAERLERLDGQRFHGDTPDQEERNQHAVGIPEAYTSDVRWWTPRRRAHEEQLFRTEKCMKFTSEDSAGSRTWETWRETEKIIPRYDIVESFDRAAYLADFEKRQSNRSHVEYDYTENTLERRLLPRDEARNDNTIYHDFLKERQSLNCFRNSSENFEYPDYSQKQELNITSDNGGSLRHHQTRKYEVNTSEISKSSHDFQVLHREISVHVKLNSFVRERRREPDLSSFYLTRHQDRISEDKPDVQSKHTKQKQDFETKMKQLKNSSREDDLRMSEHQENVQEEFQSNRSHQIKHWEGPSKRSSGDHTEQYCENVKNFEESTDKLYAKIEAMKVERERIQKRIVALSDVSHNPVYQKLDLIKSEKYDSGDVPQGLLPPPSKVQRLVLSLENISNETLPKQSLSLSSEQNKMSLKKSERKCNEEKRKQLLPQPSEQKKVGLRKSERKSNEEMPKQPLPLLTEKKNVGLKKSERKCIEEMPKQPVRRSSEQKKVGLRKFERKSNEELIKQPLPLPLEQKKVGLKKSKRKCNEEMPKQPSPQPSEQKKVGLRKSERKCNEEMAKKLLPQPSEQKNVGLKKSEIKCNEEMPKQQLPDPSEQKKMGLKNSERKCNEDFSKGTLPHSSQDQGVDLKPENVCSENLLHPSEEKTSELKCSEKAPKGLLAHPSEQKKSEIKCTGEASKGLLPHPSGHKKSEIKCSEDVPKGLLPHPSEDQRLLSGKYEKYFKGLPQGLLPHPVSIKAGKECTEGFPPGLLPHPSINQNLVLRKSENNSKPLLQGLLPHPKVHQESLLNKPENFGGLDVFQGLLPHPSEDRALIFKTEDHCNLDQPQGLLPHPSKFVLEKSENAFGVDATPGLLPHPPANPALILNNSEKYCDDGMLQGLLPHPSKHQRSVLKRSEKLPQGLLPHPLVHQELRLHKRAKYGHTKVSKGLLPHSSEDQEVSLKSENLFIEGELQGLLPHPVGDQENSFKSQDELIEGKPQGLLPHPSKNTILDIEKSEKYGGEGHKVLIPHPPVHKVLILETKDELSHPDRGLLPHPSNQGLLPHPADCNDLKSDFNNMTINLKGLLPSPREEIFTESVNNSHQGLLPHPQGPEDLEITNNYKQAHSCGLLRYPSDSESRYYQGLLPHPREY